MPQHILKIVGGSQFKKTTALHSLLLICNGKRSRLLCKTCICLDLLVFLSGAYSGIFPGGTQHPWGPKKNLENDILLIKGAGAKPL